MVVVGFLLVAFTPGLFWLWFFLRQDVYRPQPRRLIALTFILGCLSTIPVGIIENIFISAELFQRREISYWGFERGRYDFLGFSLLSLLVVGPIEELCKFAVVRLKSYRSLYFDEPMDGLVYAATASLGFASLENLLYVARYGPEVMIGRAPMSTLGHLILGSVWGYALGLHHASGYNRTGLVVISLALASIAHAIFNISLFAGSTINPLFALVGVSLVICGGVWAFGRFRWAQRASPFRNRRNYPEVLCPSCDRQIRITSRFCRFCGAAVETGGQPLFCSYCGAKNRPNSGYCTRCGDQLLAG